MLTQKFITVVKPGAQQVQRDVGMFASVTIAQSIWETGSGTHVPMDIDTGENSYNLFGRKAHGDEPFVRSNTWEVVNGARIEIVAKFRKFNSYEESVLDRSSFLKLPWYQKADHAVTAFDAAAFLIDTGYPGYAYATDPNYVKGIIGVIKAYNLTQYDLPKEDEAMNALVEQLQAQVSKLEAHFAEDVAPDWFVKEFGSGDLGGLITTPKGTAEFWRNVAVSARLIKASK